MELRETSYKILYANWFEYDNYRKDKPFVTSFFTARFKEWPVRNKVLLDRMLKERKELIEQYVKIDTENDQYMHEEVNGKFRYVMIDESKGEEFEKLFAQWENTTVQIFY